MEVQGELWRERASSLTVFLIVFAGHYSGFGNHFRTLRSVKLVRVDLLVALRVFPSNERHRVHGWVLCGRDSTHPLITGAHAVSIAQSLNLCSV